MSDWADYLSEEVAQLRASLESERACSETAIAICEHLTVENGKLKAEVERLQEDLVALRRMLGDAALMLGGDGAE